MPIEVVDVISGAPTPRMVRVKDVCEACGRTINVYEDFENTVDTDAKPTCDVRCEAVARGDGGDA